MLSVIFGSPHVEKVVLFLFVNTKAYGSQLARIFNLPLTPLQKLLSRLEKGGLLISKYEGKTRIYYLNPSYPLLQEVETLLKKAYMLLSPEKKRKYFIERIETSLKNPVNTLLEFWERLTKISRLTFYAQSNSKETSSWNGKGIGEVIVTKPKENALIFTEKGTWRGKSGEDSVFRNVFRWSLDRTAKVISLEHLRRGEEYPVFLFHLSPRAKTSLSSVDSLVCGEDTYFGQVQFEEHSFKLSWRIIGPRKNEVIDYYYS